VQPARVPVPAQRPDVLRNRVFRGSWAVRRGLLTHDQLRGRAWRRLRRDVYADAHLPLDHRLLAHGVSLIAPTGAIFAGLSALVLSGGAEFATADDAVEVALPAGQRWRPGDGVRVSVASSGGDVVVDRHGLSRTGPVRTAVDLVRRHGVEDGVVLLDRLVQAGLADLAAVRAAVAELPSCRGSRVARDVTRLADGLAQSPQETRLRLLLHRAGLPAPVAQFRIFDADGFVARVDFAYPALRLAIEYDGLWHAETGQFAKDRQRLNRLSAAGWRVIFVTAADLRHPERLIARLAAELAH
jgi:G:T-mismatch repair DNA endonuclease (very short patch repair protein)